jgi:inhibitor of KinA sporulation pathway (predicted exonuclease)
VLDHVLERLARIENIVDEQNVPALQIGKQLGLHVQLARRRGRPAVAGCLDKGNPQRQVESANQIGQEHEAPGEHADDRQRLSLVGRGNLGGDQIDTLSDLVFWNQHAHRWALEGMVLLNRRGQVKQVMAKKLDHIIVVDLESTCWEGTPPVGETSEIIEIGVCPLELSSGRRLAKRSILIKPIRSRVGDFCTRLTTLTQEQVDRGITFTEACEILRREYQTRDRLWARFGDYDRTMFHKQCEATGVPYPFGPRHLNVKTLFAISRGLPNEIGMSEALALTGVPLEGTHHRGDDDAWNIAGILAMLFGKLRA